MYIGEDFYACYPRTIANAFAAGYRTRFNQCRSTRKKYDGNKKLVPICDDVVDMTNAQSRKVYATLSAVPSMIIAAAFMDEKTSWFSAAKQIKTNVKRHRNPGKMPRFRSAKHDDHIFKAFHHNGRNMLYGNVTVFNRHHAMVEFTGRNPKDHNEFGSRFALQVHFRPTQPIRDYTSVYVNLTKGYVVFNNTPQPIETNECDGKSNIVGVDLGEVNTATLSDGTMFKGLRNRVDVIDKRIAKLQRKLAHIVKSSGFKSVKAYATQHGKSKRYLAIQAEIRRLYTYKHNVLEDHVQKVSTAIVKQYDIVCIEDLDVQKMLEKIEPVQDLVTGKFKASGRSAQRKRNRRISNAGMGRMKECLAYKCNNRHKSLVKVNPAYTSQKCNNCGYISCKNRETQAIFVCKRCGHSNNADVNAAKNILQLGIEHLQNGGGTAVQRVADSKTHEAACRLMGSRAL